MHLLQKMEQLEEKAAEFGFAWENTFQIMRQIESECHEIYEHLHSENQENRQALQEEIGDLMHAVFSLCVFCKFSPEETLQNTLEKFARRIDMVKTIAYEEQLYTLQGKPFKELMRIWESAKARLG